MFSEFHIFDWEEGEVAGLISDVTPPPAFSLFTSKLLEKRWLGIAFEIVG